MTQSYELRKDARGQDRNKWELVTTETKYKECVSCHKSLEEGFFCKRPKIVFCNACESLNPTCPFLTVQEKLKSEMHEHYCVVVVDE